MTDQLTDKLRKRATVWASNITKLANKNLGKFRGIISVQSKVTEQAGRIEIISTAKGKASRAYEYGSGVHSRLSKKSPKQLGPKGKILIKPNSGKFLAFNWEVANANPDKFTFLDDGRVLLPAVKHPGVKAANEGKGYLSPAFNEVRKQIRKEIPKETRDAVLGTFRKSFNKK
jgi:hypothetical protein